ncbi:RNA polymerase sigma factor [Fibrella sp. WM1]|uniref:RNA polymerase sigma factor n=1 Tax=Fibrella musci TaxID=3242485 RepID=UPI003521927B
MNEQDKLLWQAFREGDRQAFETLLHRYYRPLFQYGTKFLKDTDLINDCVQDLFVDLWERRIFLSEARDLKLYLFSALRNLIFKEKKRLTSQDELPDEWEEADTYVENRIIDQETDQEKQVRVQKTLIRLTKRQQEILHLKFYEALTNDQIAEILSISRPAVANLLFQAIRAFRTQWFPPSLVLYCLFS